LRERAVRAAVLLYVFVLSIIGGAINMTRRGNRTNPQTCLSDKRVSERDTGRAAAAGAPANDGRPTDHLSSRAAGAALDRVYTMRPAG
jgi:hypothetical protein